MSNTITSSIGAAPVELKETRLDIPFTVVNLTTTVLACVLPFYFYSRSAIAAFLAFYMVTSLGLTLGYHRLFAHRSFEVPRWLAYVIASCGYLAIQRGPIFWVAMHRLHHRYSDAPGRDPHTPREGLWHVHFGWNQRRRRDVWDKEIYRKWTPELVHDKFYQFLDDERLDYAACLGLLAGSFAVGGVVGGLGGAPFRFDWYNATCFLVWVGLLNRVALLHAFGFINSVCHRWGTRPFKTPGTDGSVNNVLVSLVIHGEGWHNNHHAHPHSARHGLRWYQWDPAWYSIRVLQALGLARNVYVPSPEAVRKASLSGGGKV
ncbi:MAG: fatty acid desaturase [Acidobacteria bacterium]|nr:fatty acid desaturase [Acidobacteriota bacterium]